SVRRRRTEDDDSCRVCKSLDDRSAHTSRGAFPMLFCGLHSFSISGSAAAPCARHACFSYSFICSSSYALICSRSYSKQSGQIPMSGSPPARLILQPHLQHAAFPHPGRSHQKLISRPFRRVARHGVRVVACHFLLPFLQHAASYSRMELMIKSEKTFRGKPTDIRTQITKNSLSL